MYVLFFVNTDVGNHLLPGRQVQNCDRTQVMITGHRSLFYIVPILRQPKPLTNANLKLTLLGLNTLLRLNVSICYGFGFQWPVTNTMTCDLCYVLAASQVEVVRRGGGGGGVWCVHVHSTTKCCAKRLRTVTSYILMSITDWLMEDSLVG